MLDRGFTPLTYLALQGAFLGLPLLLAPFIIQHAGWEGYGELAVFQALQSTLAALCSGYIAGHITANYYDCSTIEERKTMLCHCLVAVLINVLFVILSLQVFNCFVPVIPIDLTKLTFACLAVSATAMCLTQILIAYVQVGGHFSAALVPLSLGLVFSIAITIALVEALEERARFLSFAASNLLLAALLFKFLRIKVSVPSLVDIKKVHFDNARLIPHTLMGLVTSQFDKFILGANLSTAMLGQYSIITQLNQILVLINDYHFRLVQPKFLSSIDKSKSTMNKVFVYRYLGRNGVLQLLIIFGGVIGFFALQINISSYPLPAVFFLLFCTMMYAIYYPCVTFLISSKRGGVVSSISGYSALFYCVLVAAFYGLTDLSVSNMIISLAIFQVVHALLMYNFSVIRR